MIFPNKKIICFEGLDNCFKETNTKAFIRRLRKNFPDEDQYEIVTESFPRYSNQSCLGVEKWLDGSLSRDHLVRHPIAVNSLYSIDRLMYWFESVHGQERNIEKFKYDTKQVCFVFDRYNSSPLYNPISTDIDGTPIITADDLKYDSINYGIPSPDIFVWLRCGNFSVLEKMLKSKSNKDCNERDITFLHNVWTRSELLINSDEFDKTCTKLVVVNILDKNNNIRSKEDIAEDVWNKVSLILYKY